MFSFISIAYIYNLTDIYETFEKFKYFRIGEKKAL